MSNEKRNDNETQETKVVLTLGGFILKDSPVFRSKEDAQAFIRANFKEYAPCGVRVL